MIKCKSFQQKPYFTAILSIAIAISAILLVSAVSAVGGNLINSELSSMGLNGLTVSGLQNNKSKISDEAVLKTVSQLPEVKDYSPVVYENASIQIAGKQMDALCWGIGESADKIVSLELMHGQMITRQQINNSERVCLVDESIALQAYKRSNIIGKVARLDIGGKSVELKIIGVVKAGGSVLDSIAGSVVPNFVYMPYATMLQYSYKQTIDQVAMIPYSDDQVDKVKEAIVTVYAPSTGIKVNNLAQQRDKINGIVQIASWALALIASVALIVSGVSVMSSVSAAVMIRQKEIGIKKSVGATIPNIVFEFLQEICLVTLAGIAIGVCLSGTLISAVLLIFRLPIQFNWFLVMAGSIMTILLSLLFGLFPALRAAKMRPVEALNRE